MATFVEQLPIEVTPNLDGGVQGQRWVKALTRADSDGDEAFDFLIAADAAIVPKHCLSGLTAPHKSSPSVARPFSPSWGTTIVRRDLVLTSPHAGSEESEPRPILGFDHLTTWSKGIWSTMVKGTVSSKHYW